MSIKTKLLYLKGIRATPKAHIAERISCNMVELNVTMKLFMKNRKTEQSQTRDHNYPILTAN